MSGAKGKVVLAMSGGVDSSVAAALLKDDGYEVVGCFMRLGSPGDRLGQGGEEGGSEVYLGRRGCCSLADAEDARQVAGKLGIAFYVLNFKADFGRIIDYFVGEYHAGRTPNPCVRCNDWLKFGKLAAYARSLEADYIATGHYARLERREGRPALLRGVDRTKDQSYVLFGLKAERLPGLLLPVGRYHKAEIRRIADQLGLPVHDKPDSQEICFVPSNRYMDVVMAAGGGVVEPGRLVDTAGHILGEHPGHQHFTIGQRRGLGVATGRPVYVVAKDARTNTVVVGDRRDLQCGRLVAEQTNWLVEMPVGRAVPCLVQIRSNGQAHHATVRVDEAGRMTVDFDQPVEAAAPGQAVVCYEGERVLGGGWIQSTRRWA